MIRAAAFLLIAVLSTPALAFPGVLQQPCDSPPPGSAQQPVIGTVWVYTIPNDQMNARCNKGAGPVMFGCADLANARHPALIFLNAELSPAERDCTLIYEKAHLPPNNWVDPVAEARATDLPGVH